MSMKTFKIVNGDLVFNKSMDFEMVEGVDEVAQCVERTLTTNINEWFLNILHGLDYDKVQGKGKNKQDIELAIRIAVLQERRISAVEYIEVDIDRANRSLVVDLKTFVEGLGPIELREVVTIG